MGDATADLMRLRPVSFRYKKDYDGGSRTVLFAEFYLVMFNCFSKTLGLNEQRHFCISKSGLRLIVNFSSATPLLQFDQFVIDQRRDAKDRVLARLRNGEFLAFSNGGCAMIRAFYL